MNFRTDSLLKGLFTLTGFVLSIFTTVKAKPVNIGTAIKAASTQIQVMDQMYRDGDLLHTAYVIREECVKPLYDEVGKELLAYVFELEPHGFVVVTADDDLVPVVAYSEHGSFSWEEQPDNTLLDMLRQDLSLRLEALPLIKREIIEGNHRHWEGLIEGDPLYLEPGDSWPEAGSTWTGGWVESAWHQSSPYNDLCPIDPETEERCLVGCVATAMAQIINYWQYPSSVTLTTDDNYVTETHEIEIYAPEASIPYIDYNDGNPSDEMCAAISFSCGVGSRMDYTSDSSTAYFCDAINSFLKHVCFFNAEFKSTENSDFYVVLEENMKNSIPAMLSIKEAGTDTSRHAIICDGFRKTGSGEEWHLNFGWGKDTPDYLSDAWYTLPEGLPRGYSIVRHGIVNLYPPIRYSNKPAEKSMVLSCSPNPFSEYVEIIYLISQGGEIMLGIYDLNGRCMRQWQNEFNSQGIYGIRWNGKDLWGNQLPSGVYFIKIDVQHYTQTQRVVFINTN